MNFLIALDEKGEGDLKDCAVRIFRGRGFETKEERSKVAFLVCLGLCDGGVCLMISEEEDISSLSG